MNLQNTNGVVRGTANVEKQAKAEVEKNRTDPTERDDLIEKNTVVNIPLDNQEEKNKAVKQYQEKEKEGK